MVADFRNQNVDLNKVSKHVKDYVANVAKTEGNKKKIDTEKEFELLGQYLSGAENGLNKDEFGYIQGFMIEYQQAKEKQFEEDFVTDNTKKEVKKIMKRMGNKKAIDTDEEAQAILTMLRNSHNDLNAADIAYLRTLLIKSGYIQYLQEKEPNVTIVNVLVNEEKTADSKNVNNTGEETGVATDCEKPSNKNYPVKKWKNNTKPRLKENQKAKKEADRAEKEADRAKSEADRSAKEADRSKTEADRAKKEADSIKKAPKVSEAARAQGFGIAGKIQEELHDTWTNNGIIQEELLRVNSSNAYSFVGKMLEVTDSHTVFEDIYKRVTSDNVRHVVAALLSQAKNIGLQNDSAYKTLVDTYKFIKRRYVDKEPGEPISDIRDIQDLNSQVKNLYNKMSKVYK